MTNEKQGKENKTGPVQAKSSILGTVLGAAAIVPN